MFSKRFFVFFLFWITVTWQMRVLQCWPIPPWLSMFRPDLRPWAWCWGLWPLTLTELSSFCSFLQLLGTSPDPVLWDEGPGGETEECRRSPESHNAAASCFEENGGPCSWELDEEALTSLGEPWSPTAPARGLFARRRLIKAWAGNAPGLLSLFKFFKSSMHWRRKWQSSVLAWRIPGTGEPGGLAVYGVAQSQTRLERLSSSSGI